MEEDTGKTQHIGGGGRIHDATHSLVDYNRAGVPLMEIVSQPDIRSARAGARVRQRAARDAAGDRCVGREDGGRLDAGRRERVDPTRRHRGARHQGRGQEHELAALARARDRLRDRAPDRGDGIRRAHRPGDPRLGRGRGRVRGHAEQGRFERLPLLPRAGPRAGRAERRDARRSRAPRSRSCRPTGAPGSSPSGGSPKPGRAGSWSTTRCSRSTRTPRSRSVRRARTWRTGAPARSSASSTRPGSRPRCCRSRRTAWPSSSGSSPTARSRAAWPRTCSTSASREPKRPKQVVDERGLAQVSDEGELGRRRSTRCWRRTRASWRNTAPGTRSCEGRSGASSSVR